MRIIAILSLLLLSSPAFGKLTKEDIRTIIKEEITASEKRMKEYIDLKIETVNARIDATNARIDALDKSLNTRIDNVEPRLTNRELTNRMRTSLTELGISGSWCSRSLDYSQLRL